MGKWICNRCGKELFEKPYKNQTCDCKGRFARFTVCENCGKWFKNEKGYKFCSTECGRGKRDRGGKIEVICDCCGKTFTKYKSDLKSKKHFCSVECKREYEKQNRVERTCKECGRIFQIPKSVISGKTNASANFCCRECYDKYLSDFNRTDTYRGFKQAKRKYFSGKQFCAICGTTEKIQIHHIIPYRLTQDNSRENLIPLCVKHHKAVEYIGLDLLKADTDYERVKFLFNTILRERQHITYMKIKGCQTVGDNQVKA